MTGDVDRTLLEAVEGALIFTIDPPRSKMKRKSYSRYDDYIIDNGRRRGAISAKHQIVDTTTALHN